MKGQKRKQSGRIVNAKKCKSRSKNKENISKNSINLMEEAFLRFPHLPEQIFEKLDNKSLTNSRMVGIPWHNFIDEREYPWIRIKEISADLNAHCGDEKTAFHVVCMKGQSKIAEILMKNSAQFNVDLNSKNN